VVGLETMNDGRKVKVAVHEKGKQGICMMMQSPVNLLQNMLKKRLETF